MDYFIRFAQGKNYMDYTNIKTYNIFNFYIVPIFGWPRGIYSDNGSYFVNINIFILFAQKSITYFIGPVLYLVSTGLLERTIQKVILQLSKKCLEMGLINAQSTWIRDIFLNLNTKTIKVYKYSLSQLILGFKLQFFYYNIILNPIPNLSQIE